MKQIVLFLYLLVCAMPLFAQQKVSGRVHDAKGSPIESAMVMLRSDTTQQAQIKGYAMTEADGTFAFDAVVAPNDWLIVKCMGYLDARCRMDGTQKERDLVMKEDNHTLSELIVKGKYPGVKVSGDTIKFDTNRFKIGTEDNIGEVLRRLPGVTVSETGKVSFAGKSIDKVLIDGKDVFSSNDEGVIVNNMNAGLMVGAEILTDYQNKSLADAFRSRKLTALNIKTTGKWKSTGNVTALGGIKNKYNEKSTLIYMGDKLSLTGLLSLNNIGMPILTVDDLAKDVRGMDLGMGNRSFSLNLSPEEAEMLYPSKDVFKKRGGLLSLSANYHPSSKFRMNTNLMLADMAQRTQQYSDTWYFLDSTHVASNATSDLKNRLARLTLAEEWKPNDVTELNATTQIGVRKNDRHDAETSTDAQPLNVKGVVDAQSFSLLQNLSAKVKVGQSLLFANANLSYDNNDRKDSVLTDSAYFALTSYQQGVGRYRYLSDYSKKYKRLNVNAEVGYTINFAQLYNFTVSSSYVYQSQSARIAATAQPTTKEYVDEQAFYVSMSLSKTKGQVQYSVGAKVANHDYSTSRTAFQHRRWSVEPQASFQWNMSSCTSLSLRGEYELMPITFDYLLESQLMGRYNTQTLSSAINKPYSRRVNIAADFRSFNIMAQSFFSLYGGYVVGLDEAHPYVSQQGILSSYMYHGDGRTTNLFANASWQKTLPFAPISSKLTLGYSRNTSQSMVNLVEDVMTSERIKASLGLTSRFKGWFNVELSGGYVYGNTHFRSAERHNKTNEVDLASVFHVVVSDWRGTLNASYSHINSYYYRDNLVNLGFSVEYRFAKDWSAKLQGENLLHVNNNEWVDVNTSAFCMSSWTYRKLPGYLMLGISYRF